MSQVPSGIPTITAATPVTIPAQTFASLWLGNLQITIGLNGDPGAAVAQMTPYTTDGNGNRVPAPGVAPAVVTVDNLLVRAQTDTALATLMGQLVAYLIGEGVAQGVIAAPQS